VAHYNVPGQPTASNHRKIKAGQGNAARHAQTDAKRSRSQNLAKPSNQGRRALNYGGSVDQAQTLPMGNVTGHGADRADSRYPTAHLEKKSRRGQAHG
jgi:hypothetical protein